MKKIYGILATALLMAGGLSSCSEDFSQPPVPEPEGGRIGTGWWNNTMTAYQASIGQAMPDTLEQVWVTGYIVGYIDVNVGTVASDNSAKLQDAADGCTVNTNILISWEPDQEDWNNCASVQISGAARSALNLRDNPDNMGKEVTVLGTTSSKYCGIYGVRSVSVCMMGAEGDPSVIITKNPEPDQPDQPDQPSQTGTEIFTSLTDNADGWTFDNVQMPEGGSYVWNWRTSDYGSYLNASAYISGAPKASLSYAISPEISLAGVTKAQVSFDHAAKFQTTLRTLCGFAVREKGATAWTEIAIPTWPAAGSWSFVNSGAIDLSAFDGKTVEVAFKYASTAEGADTWEIKNLKVTGTK